MSSCRNVPKGGGIAVILIVEDEDQVRVLAEGILQDSGHTTLSASSFDQALALVEETQQIDLIFTDIGLQSDIQAGLMLAQEAIKRKINVPVLYTTGQGLTDGMQAMFVERFGFLAKPYTPEQLLVAVENLLSKN
jgi:DNA-binding NtrC family response regulator